MRGIDYSKRDIRKGGWVGNKPTLALTEPHDLREKPRKIV